MLRRVFASSLVIGLVFMAGTSSAPAQSIAPDYDYEDYDRARIDRYLDIEVWTDHSDGEYYEGDNIVLHFRVNRDAFVALYSIDTRGRVNLLFPTYDGEDNYVEGGVTYSLPGGQDDFDLEVSGPEGFENIQIIASRERFPIPEWYNGPELVADDDRDGYMDWLNSNYFTDYPGQRFAYDRALIYVSEWEEEYFRPIYRPYYPSWTVYGNCYIDYPWGASIYVNGIYWGCAPLYVPRIAVGWHTITIYDRHGYCWENDFHVSRYNTVVFNKTIVNTSPTVKSKYKEVRTVGYRDPVKAGYSDYNTRSKEFGSVFTANGATTKSTRTKTSGSSTKVATGPEKKYVRGSTKLVKTDRGYEVDAATAVFPMSKSSSKRGSTSRELRSGNYHSTSTRSTGGSHESGKTSRTRSGYGSSSTGSSSGTSSRLKSSGKSSSKSSSRRRTTGQARPKGKSSSGKVEKKTTSKTSSSSAKKSSSKVSTKSSNKSSGSKASSKSSSKSSSSKSSSKSKSKSGGKKK